MNYSSIGSPEQGLECGLFTHREHEYAERLIKIANFILSNPTLAPTNMGKIEFGSKAYWTKINQKFFANRKPSVPSEPKTIPDPMVEVILKEYFQIDTNPRGSISPAKLHLKSMAAENFVGVLLEKYIASKVEPIGWVWCSGSVVKQVDFLIFENGETTPLQIKNRDNSENSSSAAVRQGTEIIKWFRTFARTGKTNWNNFPTTGDNAKLSEVDFRQFAIQSFKRKACSG